MKNINLIVGQNIRTLRYHHGMTTKTLAKLLEVSQQQVSRYERGVNKIDVNIIFKIVTIFCISYEDIFSEFKNENTGTYLHMKPEALRDKPDLNHYK